MPPSSSSCSLSPALYGIGGGGAFLHPRARKARFLGAQDGRTSINFRVLYQLIKA